MRRFFCVLTVLSIILPLHAGSIPNQITYQGTLKEKGVPVNATRTLSFRVTNQDGTAVYWSSGNKSVQVTQGLFAVPLSPTGVDWQAVTPYIEVSVEGQALTPREPLTANVYSMMSASIIDGVITRNKINQQSFDSSGVGFLPIGGIIPFAGNAAPAGYLPCDGRQVSRMTYAALFAVIGTTWGIGDGAATFNLPDFRGKTTIGDGQGSGLTTRVVGESFGEETHKLIISEMPTHAHLINDPGHHHRLKTMGSATMNVPPFDTLPHGDGGIYQNNGMVETTTTGITIQSAGGDAGHNNMQPSAVVKYLIKF